MQLGLLSSDSQKLPWEVRLSLKHIRKNCSHSTLLEWVSKHTTENFTLVLIAQNSCSIIPCLALHHLGRLQGSQAAIAHILQPPSSSSSPRLSVPPSRPPSTPTSAPSSTPLCSPPHSRSSLRPRTRRVAEEAYRAACGALGTEPADTGGRAAAADAGGRATAAGSRRSSTRRGRPSSSSSRKQAQQGGSTRRNKAQAASNPKYGAKTSEISTKANQCSPRR